MNRKRVLFVEQNDDGTVGGSHHSLLLLVQHLDRAAFEPVVAFYQPHALVDEFQRYARVILLPTAKPVRVTRGGSAARRGPVSALALLAQKLVNGTKATAAVQARISRVLRTIRPDLIHMNNSVVTGIEWPIAARLSQARIVAHQRGFVAPSSYARWFDRIICISDAVRRDLIERSPALAARSVRIYNGIDAGDFTRRAAADTTTLRRELGLTDEEHLIGLVGNIQPWKGQEVLLRALTHLPDDPPWRCLIVGDTPSSPEGEGYRRQLRELVRSLNLERRVVLTGYRHDVAAVINAVDTLVHTSVKPEPFGRVILEGMALGKTVLATNHGGPQEIIENGRTGFLLPPGDSRALAHCLNQVLCAPELRGRIGRAAAMRVARDFSAVECATRIQDVYRSLWPGTQQTIPPILLGANTQ